MTQNTQQRMNVIWLYFLCASVFFFRGTPRLFHAINIPRTRRPITFLLSPHVILFSVMCHIYAIFIRFPFNNNNNNNNIKTHKVPHSFSANIDKLPQYSRQHTLVLVALEMYIVISNMHPPRFRFVDDKFGYRLGITSRPFWCENPISVTSRIDTTCVNNAIRTEIRQASLLYIQSIMND